MPDYRNNLMDVIYQLESSSGKNKRAYRTNSVGALGGYQLTPDAFADVRKLHPDTWGNVDFRTVATNDALAREAASDYLMLLSNQLSRKKLLTNENLLAAYHSGAGNVINNNLGPYGRQYKAQARALAGVQPGEVW